MSTLVILQKYKNKSNSPYLKSCLILYLDLNSVKSLKQVQILVFPEKLLEVKKVFFNSFRFENSIHSGCIF